MVLNFNRLFLEALQEIDFVDYQEWLIHDGAPRDHHSSCEIVENYGKAKWGVVDAVNQRFNTSFDLHNWLHKDQSDELSYFLNEVGSNALNHSEQKAPHKFHLWLGNKGFIVGIEQQGQGFDAQYVYENQVKQNGGAAFKFFSNCHHEIFFDDHRNAKMVLMKVKL